MHHLLDAQERLGVPPHKPNEAHLARRLRRRGHLVCARGGERERLLDEDVFARAERRDRLFHMVLVRARDHHEVDIWVRKDRLESRVSAWDVEFRGRMVERILGNVDEGDGAEEVGGQEEGREVHSERDLAEAHELASAVARVRLTATPSDLVLMMGVGESIPHAQMGGRAGAAPA